MFKYVPVLRCRQAENSALKTSKITNKIIPMIEIIQDYPTGRVPQKPKQFDQVYIAELSSYNYQILVDIPMYIDLSVPKIKAPYRTFLSNVYASPVNRINMLKSLAPAKNIIPVVTYNPNAPYASNYLTIQENNFRPLFKKLAFRIYSNSDTTIFSEISEIIHPNDILILDIDADSYLSQAVATNISLIVALKAKINISTVILNTPIPNHVQNTNIKHGKPVPSTNNSMLQLYPVLQFDAFGDYAGIKKDNLVEGFLGYISSIYYSYKTNEYIGYTAKPSIITADFKNIIAPAIVSSTYWAQYSSTHHAECPGCKHIKDISSGVPGITSGNRVTWKTISIQHYIYTMNEFL